MAITVTRRLQALLRTAGLRHQRFHDLRHAWASLMLAQGVAPRVVMEVLGCSPAQRLDALVLEQRGAAG